jgi:3-deoxy-manno-octulosonate cytidylyltransferase (CMP-KDO synthetase)
MQSLPGDIVVMVQGDEPLLNPEAIFLVAQPLLNDPDLRVVNMLSPLHLADDCANLNIVKAVCDQRENIIYLTRAPVPYCRNKTEVPVYRQTGIMAFRAEFLPVFSALSETPLEIAESVDMLRVLEHGIRIRGVVVGYPTIGVDLPSDVELVEAVLRHDPVQSALHETISNVRNNLQ